MIGLWLHVSMLNIINFVFCTDVDKSHFKLVKLIGVGSHGVIWLVERRKGKMIGARGKLPAKCHDHRKHDDGKKGE